MDSLLEKLGFITLLMLFGAYCRIGTPIPIAATFLGVIWLYRLK